MHHVGFSRLTLFAGSCLPLVSGCASPQLTANTVDVSARVDDIYTKQVLNNFSKFVDDPFAIPSQAILSASQVQTTDTIQPSITFPFSNQVLTSVASAATGTTKTTSNTLAGAGASVQGTNSQQQNFTTAPLSDAMTLRNQQALYRHALLGTPLLNHYTPQRIYFNNQFYLDPYYIQLPQCVLCAQQQPYIFSYKVPVPKLRENPALPKRWLFVDGNRVKLADPIDLGHFGNHELYMERAAYESGVLSSFVLFTLSFTVPAETLTGPPAQQQPTIVEIVPTPPANGPHEKGPEHGPGREGTLPENATPPATRYIIPPPSLSIPPATNQQLAPADRQNFITINPSIIPPP
jgi:hypothetical protein